MHGCGGDPVSWPGETGWRVQEPSHPAGGDCLGQTRGRRPSGPQLHPPEEVSLGAVFLRPALPCRAQSQSQGPRWGGRGWGGGAFLQPPQLAGPALRLEGRLTVRARTQTRAWASKLSSTEAQVGVGGHTQRGHRTPGALFWSCWLSTDPTTLRFALNNPVGPPGQQQGLCRRPGEGGVGT